MEHVTGVVCFVFQGAILGIPAYLDAVEHAADVFVLEQVAFQARYPNVSLANARICPRMSA